MYKFAQLLALKAKRKTLFSIHIHLITNYPNVKSRFISDITSDPFEVPKNFNKFFSSVATSSQKILIVKLK